MKSVLKYVILFLFSTASMGSGLQKVCDFVRQGLGRAAVATFVGTGISAGILYTYEKYTDKKLQTLLAPLKNELDRTGGQLHLNTMNDFAIFQKLPWEYQEKIKHIIIGSNITEIPPRSFFDLYGLQKVEGENIQTIGVNAFNGCLNLIEINMPNAMEIQGGGISETGLNGLDFPKLERITGRQFSPKAKFLITPNLTEIAPHVFSGSHFKNIYIPNIRTIGDYAFWRSNELTKISLPNTIQELNAYLFEKPFEERDATIQIPVLPFSSTIHPKAFSEYVVLQFRVPLRCQNDEQKAFNFLQTLTRHVCSTRFDFKFGDQSLLSAAKNFLINSLFSGRITVHNTFSKNLDSTSLRRNFAPLFMSDKYIDTLTQDDIDAYKNQLASCLDAFFDIDLPENMNDLSVEQQKDVYLTPVKKLMDENPNLYNFLDPDQIDVWERDNPDSPRRFEKRKIAVFLSLINGLSPLPFLSQDFLDYLNDHPNANFILIVIRHLPLMGSSYLKKLFLDDDVENFESYQAQRPKLFFTKYLMHFCQYPRPIQRQIQRNSEEEYTTKCDLLTLMESACLCGSSQIFDCCKREKAPYDPISLLALAVLSENSDFLANRIMPFVDQDIESSREKEIAYWLAACVAFVTGQERTMEYLLEHVQGKFTYLKAIIETFCTRLHAIPFHEYTNLRQKDPENFPSYIKTVVIHDDHEMQNLLSFAYPYTVQGVTFEAPFEVFSVFRQNFGNDPRFQDWEWRHNTITEVPSADAFRWLVQNYSHFDILSAYK